MTSLLLLAFVVVFVGLLGAYWLFVVKPEQQTAETLNRRLKGAAAPERRKSSKILRDNREYTLSALDRFVNRASGLGRPLTDMVEQSGLKLSVGGLLLLSLGVGAGAFVVGYVALRLFVAGLILGVIAAVIPFMIVNWKRQQRIAKFEEQFPEALDLLARSLRAGHALTTGILLVAEEMPTPVGPEFRLLYDRQNFGMPFPDALRDFGERIPVLDAKFFTTAVLIQRESGGNLSEVLGNLSSVIRERFRVKRQVRVLSAHGRITGWVLSGLPPSLAAAFMITSPNHMATLVGDPLGRQMIIAAICLQVVGTLIIRKLVNIEY